MAESEDLPGHLHAAQARHADIEKGDVGPQGVDLLQRRDAVFGFGADGERRPDTAEFGDEGAAQGRFVIRDEGAQDCRHNKRLNRRG